MVGYYMDETGIREKLTEFVLGDPRNAMAAHGGMRMYDAPLVGFAAADDPYFEEFRKPGVIGPGLLLPRDWLPNASTVISYFLPFTEGVVASNRTPGLPSEEWVSARIDGEAFNNAVRAYLVSLLRETGEEAVAPGVDPRFQVAERVSNWSERHAAFAAGLGTFGLHRALITAKGTAGRIGSVITSCAFTPTKRAYTQYFEYCPYLTRGKCGACMKRCPPAAITESGKDHRICGDYLDNEILPLYAPRYGCAKCNTRVPCEHGIPAV